MAIKTVKATIDGQIYTLTYNGTTGKYEATLTAPTTTSYNKSGGYYGVTVEATDEAGNVTKTDSTNPDNRLVVKEKNPPIITNVSPSSGARVTTSSPKITGTFTDETNGSGINLDTFVLKIDGATIANGDITFTPITNGFNFEYTKTGIAQGSHTITINVKDNDGNAATQKSVSFIVDTIAPSLNVTAPADGLITNTKTINVTGTTSEATSNPIVVTIKVNGIDQGAVTVANNAFSKSVTLSEGANDISVKVLDTAGLSTSVNRTVTLDTAAPEIVSIELMPNPVDAGATYVIRVTAND